ncbi:hypothetical protein HPP92_024905 [Vanilla planifolia]|uniref:Uncharacterized protein n=1 Tax=Vanilla planifolia TaxID=51239 RepID=A0A835PG56_VANPL|nr:hypothetical protein HPP92_025188 [Vanilla planifolia]KAG0453601.1 hypothetical protein HPP92_024905 [Vanilla planifolia]
MVQERAAALVGRACRLLRRALPWARKSGAIRRWARDGGGRILRGEREFSIEETPTFRFMRASRGSFRREDTRFRPTAVSDNLEAEEEKEEEEEEGGIDGRAERFIVEFYEQLRLQRQASYNAMLYRSIC